MIFKVIWFNTKFLYIYPYILMLLLLSNIFPKIWFLLFRIIEISILINFQITLKMLLACHMPSTTEMHQFLYILSTLIIINFALWYIKYCHIMFVLLPWILVRSYTMLLFSPSLDMYYFLSLPTYMLAFCLLSICRSTFHSPGLVKNELANSSMTYWEEYSLLCDF